MITENQSTLYNTVVHEYKFTIIVTLCFITYYTSICKMYGESPIKVFEKIMIEIRENTGVKRFVGILNLITFFLYIICIIMSFFTKDLYESYTIFLLIVNIVFISLLPRLMQADEDGADWPLIVICIVFFLNVLLCSYITIFFMYNKLTNN
jgi:hypothetical protein